MRRKRRKSRRRNPKLKHIVPFVLLAGGAVVVYLMLKKNGTETNPVVASINATNVPAVGVPTASGVVSSNFIGPLLPI